MLEGKALSEFTNLFSPNNFQKNDGIILKCFVTDVSKWLNAIQFKHGFHKTPNMYPNLGANISNEQQLRLNKINEIKIIY